MRPSDYQAFAAALLDPAIAPSIQNMRREMLLARAASAIANQVVAEAKDMAAGSDVKEVLTLVKGGDIKNSILAVAAEKSADLIVMGSHNREGFDALLHPSLAESVRKDALCPCVVVYAGHER